MIAGEQDRPLTQGTHVPILDLKSSTGRGIRDSAREQS